MMAIKIAGTEVISQNRSLNAITALDASTASVIAAAVPGELNQYLNGMGSNWYFVSNSNNNNNSNTGIYQAIGRRGTGLYVAYLIGGGGGGAAGSRAGTNTVDSYGYGGGGGGIAKVVFNYNANTNLTCAIGAGGAGANTKAEGAHGGATTLTIGNTLVATANGGKGGPGSPNGAYLGYSNANPLSSGLNADGRWGGLGGYGVIGSNGDNTNFTVNFTGVSQGGTGGYIGSGSSAVNRTYKGGAMGGGGVQLFYNSITNSISGFGVAGGGWQTNNFSGNNSYGGSAGGSPWGIGGSNSAGSMGKFPALRSTLFGGPASGNSFFGPNMGNSNTYLGVKSQPAQKLIEREIARKASGTNPSDGAYVPYAFGGKYDDRTYFGSVGEGGFVMAYAKPFSAWGMCGGPGLRGNSTAFLNDPIQDDACHGGPFSGGGGCQQTSASNYTNNVDYPNAGDGGMYGGGGGGGHSGNLATDSAVNVQGGDGGHGTIIIAKVL